MKKTALTLALALSASSAFAQDCGKSKVAADVAGNNQVVASTGSSLCLDSGDTAGILMAVLAAAIIADIVDDNDAPIIAEPVVPVEPPVTSTGTTTST